jgi:hypothetical protein
MLQISNDTMPLGTEIAEWRRQVATDCLQHNLLDGVIRGLGYLLEASVDGIRELDRYGLIRHGFALRILVLGALYRAYKDRSNWLSRSLSWNTRRKRLAVEPETAWDGGLGGSQGQAVLIDARLSDQWGIGNKFEMTQDAAHDHWRIVRKRLVIVATFLRVVGAPLRLLW